jgi:osmoprotectant transport system permease protein
MSEQLALLPGYLTAHLQLTLLALFFSTSISLPLGVAVTRVPWLEAPALAVAGIIQTIPSLALLAVMVPLLAYFDLQSIGFLPALIGLTLYGVLPVLRNTVTAISNVDPALKEAARGVGMTPAQQLYKVELPLAMPVIVAGIRTATVWVVGIATLSTPVGATSLGNYIFSGLQTRNDASVLVGCFAAAILALLLDSLVRTIEDGVRTRRRGRVVAALGILAALYAYTLATLAAPLVQERDRPIRIGSKTFTEQYILSAMLARWIHDETGHPAALMQSLGSVVAFDALAAGDIDLYVDYSGTLWANEMGRETLAVGRKELLRALEAYLHHQHGITLAARLGFENTYALAMRRRDAEARGIRRISDLARHAPSLTMGSDYEFFARPEWAAVRTTYGLAFAELRSMDSTLMYQAVARGNVDVISAFSTDGRIAAFDLRVLEDDRNVIPPYDAVVLASPRLAEQNPEVLKALGRLEGRIDADTMREMNRAVDEDGQPPSAVAKAFVERLRDPAVAPRPADRP